MGYGVEPGTGNGGARGCHWGGCCRTSTANAPRPRQFCRRNPLPFPPLCRERQTSSLWAARGYWPPPPPTRRPSCGAARATPTPAPTPLPTRAARWCRCACTPAATTSSPPPPTAPGPFTTSRRGSASRRCCPGGVGRDVWSRVRFVCSSVFYPTGASFQRPHFRPPPLSAPLPRRSRTRRRRARAAATAALRCTLTGSSSAPAPPRTRRSASGRRARKRCGGGGGGGGAAGGVRGGVVCAVRGVWCAGSTALPLRHSAIPFLKPSALLPLPPPPLPLAERGQV